MTDGETNAGLRAADSLHSLEFKASENDVANELIQIGEVQLRGGSLSARIDMTAGLRRYFRENIFYCEYDFPLEDIDPGLLVVPVLNNVIQVAWSTGADIQVDVIDENHLKSCEALRDVFADFYPTLSFDTTIEGARSGPTIVEGNNTLQLFSGGIDSVATYLSNQDQSPIPVMIDYEPAGIHREVVEFAKTRGQSGHIVRSNCYSFLNRRNLDSDFGHLTDGTWWGGFQHGMGLLGMTAPITQWRNADKVLIATQNDASLNAPWGWSQKMNNLVKWATVVCRHDGYEQTRQQKIANVIGRHIAKTNEFPLLMVCNSYARIKDQYNCSRCTKCAQAIVGLLIADIDPRQYGFEVTEKTFSWIKECLDTAAFFTRKSGYWAWEDCHRSLRNRRSLGEHNIGGEHNIDGVTNFLKWFAALNLTYENNFNNISVMRDRPGYKLERHKDTYRLAVE